MIAGRDRARRLQAALGEGAPLLMGCALVVLHESPRRSIAATAPAAANEDVATGGGTSRSAAERVR